MIRNAVCEVLRVERNSVLFVDCLMNVSVLSIFMQSVFFNHIHLIFLPSDFLHFIFKGITPFSPSVSHIQVIFPSFLHQSFLPLLYFVFVLLYQSNVLNIYLFFHVILIFHVSVYLCSSLLTPNH